MGSEEEEGGEDVEGEDEEAAAEKQAKAKTAKIKKLAKEPRKGTEQMFWCAAGCVMVKRCAY